MLRRILLVLAVGLVMAAMVVAMTAPAFARGNPTDKENPHATFEVDGTIEVQQQCAPGVGGCDPPGGGKPGTSLFGNIAKGGNPGFDSNFTICPGTGQNTQDC